MDNNNIIVPPVAYQSQKNPSVTLSAQMIHQLNIRAQQEFEYLAHLRHEAQEESRMRQARAQSGQRARDQAYFAEPYQMNQRVGSQSSISTGTPAMTPMGTPTPDEKIASDLKGRMLKETLMVDGELAHDWAAKAIRTVMKTIKKNKCVDEFHDAITTGNAHSKCCPARNDKQPGGFGRSNTFFLKLFRFPWLKWGMQIESIPYCRYQYINNRDHRQVCLNPYHYKRMFDGKAPVGPIIVNKFGEYGEPPLRPEDPRDDWMVAEQNISDRERLENKNAPNITMKGDELRMFYAERGAFDPKDPLNDFPMPDPNDIQSNIALGNAFSFSLGPKFEVDQGETGESGEDETFSYQSGLSSPASDMAFSPDVFIPTQNSQHAVLFQSHGNVEEQPKAPEEKKQEEKKDSVEPMEPMEQEETVKEIDAPLDQSELEFESIPAELTPLQSIASSDDSDKSLSPLVAAAQPMEDDSDKGDEEMMDLDDDDEARSPKRPRLTNGPATPCEPKPLYRSSVAELAALAKGTYECVEYEETDHWLGLVYNEEALAIGDYRMFRKHHCLIDGFFAQDDEQTRFSIGFYTNPKRTQFISQIRSIIGKGCRMYQLAGDVFLENISAIPVFVQSISANMKNGFQLNTVNKLPPRATMKIFDMKIFSKALSIAADKTYNDVFALTRLCTIRISFCKGWGNHYRRSSVVRSPVWFQAHLHSPMKWIDRVLSSMGIPPRQCSSRT